MFFPFQLRNEGWESSVNASQYLPRCLEIAVLNKCGLMDDLMNSSVNRLGQTDLMERKEVGFN